MLRQDGNDLMWFPLLALGRRTPRRIPGRHAGLVRGLDACLDATLRMGVCGGIMPLGLLLSHHSWPPTRGPLLCAGYDVALDILYCLGLVAGVTWAGRRLGTPAPDAPRPSSKVGGAQRIPFILLAVVLWCTGFWGLFALMNAHAVMPSVCTG